jgi:putative proteasome-type protease
MNDGLVFMSDTRTNAGMDNVSRNRKIARWSVPGERAITLVASGNLATTQAVVSILDERTKVPEERSPSILEAPTMFQVASIVGRTQREAIAANAKSGHQAGSAFSSTLILGGQIAGQKPKLFLIYPEGNFIEAQDDSPFFQIGETKYGRPILVRVFDPAMSFEDAVKLLLVSFDSTMKANVSVGPPLDLQLYRRDSLRLEPLIRFAEDDPSLARVSEGWGDALRSAFARLPDIEVDLFAQSGDIEPTGHTRAGPPT